MAQNNKSDICIRVLIAFAHEFYTLEMKSARNVFFKNAPPSSRVRADSETRFLEWFIFDWRHPYSKKSLVDLFLSSKFSREMSAIDRLMFQNFKKNVFSFFEILDVKIGQIKMQDLATQKNYDVLEYRGSFDLKPLDILNARLLPWGEQWVISGPCAPFRGETAYSLKRELVRQEDWSEVDAIAIHEVLAGDSSDEPDLSFKDMPLDQIRELMEQALKETLELYSISVKELESWIVNDRPDHEIREVIISKMKPQSHEKINHFFEIYQGFSNALPRNSRFGFSPQELQAANPSGPQEEMLNHDLLRAAMHAIRPESYPDAEVRREAAKSFYEKWLDEPQNELGGKTPREVILLERKNMGNPRIDFSLEISMTPIPVVEDFSKELAAIQEKDVPLLSDLRLLLSLCGATFPKSEPQKKKVLRQMEWQGNFERLDCRQDAEEYLEFLLVLAGPAKKLFDEKLSAAETLIRLAKIWCLELRWENLQQDPLLKQYAKDFQTKLQFTFAHVGEITEKQRKITAKEVVYQMFGSRKEILDHDSAMRKLLSEVILQVLIRYFLWFGILTKKGKVNNSTYLITDSGGALFAMLWDALSFPRNAQPVQNSGG